MKPRTVTILWVIAILLGVSVFLLKQSEGGSGENKTDRTAGEKLLPDFPAGETSTIVISGPEQSVSLMQKDGKWTVSERDGFPANTRNINDLLRTLADLKVTQGIQAGPSFAPRFGMDEKSSDPAEHGITATFKDKSGTELAELSFGKNLESTASASPFGGGATGRYVRNHADESGFYAVSEVFGTLSADPKSWLADDFIKLDKIKSISVTKPGSDETEWALTRADESADFGFTEAFPGVKIDPAAVSPLKSLFSYARFDDVVPSSEVEAKSSPDKVRKAVITTFEGFTYTITLQPAKAAEPKGGAASENYLMTVAVEAELPKERKKPEGEKEEDAKAAQKAFDERLKTLAERLAETKALEGRTFEVSKFTVDALLKTRTDLMDKGPGPEAGTNPGAPTPPPGTAAFTPPIEIPMRRPEPEEAAPDNSTEE